ncbi:MAG TPA: ATP-binding protein [Saprospiraceae bacterium]|nr:ATP-binding protein [Saprospiraceae bacterium]HMQ82786.1 ATP-binding protein [Saprospiraceae bacterium]
MQHFIGREKEQKRLDVVKNSHKSEFVAIYGRRRVGKTMLIRRVFGDSFAFQVTAIANVTKQQQLLNFATALRKYDSKAGSLPIPDTWFTAFQQLTSYLDGLTDRKKIIFFDELPWFDNQKSDFIQSLEHFWNSWASAREDIVLIVCGSAASWMINELINHRGGLHNRVTEKLQVEPFKLREAEKLLLLKNPNIDRYQVLQLYMAMGGIPFYLEAVQGDQSATQNIERICFASDGLLRTEFDNLYKALFKNSERYIAVVRAIAAKAQGLTRAELIDMAKLPDSGTSTKLLDELEKSGFIRKYLPFQRQKRESLYQLVDFYTLFYLKFIEKSDPVDENTWLNLIDHPTQRAWSGYAFEQICLYHVQQIKKALGIAGVLTQTSGWRSKRKQDGAQIDLVIDRRDHVINLCEMKFSISPFSISKAYADELMHKIGVFREETKTHKALHLTMITSKGLNKNSWSGALVQNDLDAAVLFEE